MIVTTTNSIENAEIEKYIDLISTNVVIGTNFFSDFGHRLLIFLVDIQIHIKTNYNRSIQVQLIILNKKQQIWVLMPYLG